MNKKTKTIIEPQRVSNFWSDDNNRDLSLDEDLDNIKPYLRNIITDLQNSDTCKFQLRIAIDFISSKDT